MTTDLFRDQWLRAVDNFAIKQWTVEGIPGIHYIHAEAGTGSKYEVFSTRIRSYWRSDDPTCFVTVANPWEAVWTSPWESWAYPDYVLEHWRSPRRLRAEMHGGDTAAITICINIVLGHDTEDVLKRAREWA